MSDCYGDAIISIIIPAYNVQKTIIRAIDSVLNQPIRNVEILVIDDGSTDKTKQFVKMKAKNDKRVRLYEQENLGPGAARNRGIEYSKGEYVLFLDADDCLEDSGLKHLYERIMQDNVDLVVGGFNVFFISKTGRVSLKRNQTEEEHQAISALQGFEILYRYDMAGTCCAKLYKRKLLFDNSITFPNVENGEDRLFVVSYISAIDKISIIRTTVYNYYYGRTGGASRFNINKFKSMERYYEELLKLEERQPGLSVKPNDFILRGAISSMCSCMDKSCPLSDKEKKIFFNEIQTSKSVSYAFKAYETPSVLNFMITKCIKCSIWKIQKIMIYGVYLCNSYLPDLINRFRDLHNQK